MDVAIDCRAACIAFIDQVFVHLDDILLLELQENPPVEVVDGRPIESGEITHIAKVGMDIQDHKEQLPMFLCNLGSTLLFLKSRGYDYTMLQYGLH